MKLAFKGGTNNLYSTLFEIENTREVRSYCFYILFKLSLVPCNVDIQHTLRLRYVKLAIVHCALLELWKEKVLNYLKPYQSHFYLFISGLNQTW